MWEPLETWTATEMAPGSAKSTEQMSAMSMVTSMAPRLAPASVLASCKKEEDGNPINQNLEYGHFCTRQNVQGIMKPGHVATCGNGVGAGEGLGVGRAVGSGVGAGVGAVVGDEEGSGVGELVGDFVLRSWSPIELGVSKH